MLCQELKLRSSRDLSLLLRLLPTYRLFKDFIRSFGVDSITTVLLRNDLPQDAPDISLILGQFIHDWYELLQLSIIQVVVPGNAWKGIQWLEKVGIRRVVDYNNVFNSSAQSREVFNV